MQFLSYRIHKAAWPGGGLKLQQGHAKVNIELIQSFDVENTTIKLQLDTTNIWSYRIYKVLGTAWPPAHPGNDTTPPA